MSGSESLVISARVLHDHAASIASDLTRRPRGRARDAGTAIRDLALILAHPDHRHMRQQDSQKSARVQIVLFCAPARPSQPYPEGVHNGGTERVGGGAMSWRNVISISDNQLRVTSDAIAMY